MERRSFLGRFGVGAAGLLVPPAVLADAAPPATVRVPVLTSFVAGFQYHAGMLPAVAATLRAGRLLALRPEPENPHDRHAVAVALGENGAKIGYVPRRDNAVLSALVQGGARVVAEIVAFDPSASPWERVEMQVYVEAVAASVPVEPFAWHPTGLVVPVETARRAWPTDDSRAVDFDLNDDEELDVLLLEAEVRAAERRTKRKPKEALPGFVWTPEQEEAERRARLNAPPRPSLAKVRARRNGAVADTLDGLRDAADGFEARLNAAADRLHASVTAGAQRVEDGVHAVEASERMARHGARIVGEVVEGRIQGAGEAAWEVVRTVERHANARSRQAHAVVNAVLDTLG